MEKLLVEVAKRFEKAGLTWCVGGSLLLYYKGLASEVNDIDILIMETDVLPAVQLLSELGSCEKGDPLPPFCSVAFYNCLLPDGHVDVISGFRIEHAKGIYKLPFDSLSITDSEQVRGFQVPLGALEDWYVVYQLYEKKRNKADGIEAHLRQFGVKHPQLLQRSLQQSLPNSVRSRVQSML